MIDKTYLLDKIQDNFGDSEIGFSDKFTKVIDKIESFASNRKLRHITNDFNKLGAATFYLTSKIVGQQPNSKQISYAFNVNENEMKIIYMQLCNSLRINPEFLE